MNAVAGCAAVAPASPDSYRALEAQLLLPDTTEFLRGSEWPLLLLLLLFQSGESASYLQGNDVGAHVHTEMNGCSPSAPRRLVVLALPQAAGIHMTPPPPSVARQLKRNHIPSETTPGFGQLGRHHHPDHPRAASAHAVPRAQKIAHSALASAR